MSDWHGNFVWYELATHDVDGAIRFYKDVVGWGTEEWQGGGYTRWTAGETAVGGIRALPETERKAGAAPHWLGYVLADDVDAVTRKAESLGATTRVPPTDIPDVGRFSVFADPHGAVLALLKPMGPEAHPPPNDMPPRHFVWHELLSDDWEAAFDFYSKLFGWRRIETLSMPNGTYLLYGNDRRTLGGMMTRPQGYPYPAHWLYYVTLPDLDAALGRVKRNGGSVMMGPMEVPGGDRVAQCFDPQRAAFALHGK